MIDTLLFIERRETDKMDKKNMFSLEGKIALVTGGAHGIGFAIAESYAEAGATVVFNCSNEESLKRGLAAYKCAGTAVKTERSGLENSTNRVGLPI